MHSIIVRILAGFSGKSISLYATRFGSILLQSISLFLVAALVSIEEFGKFSFLFSASQLTAVIIGAGGEQMLIREVVYSDENNEGKGSYSLIVSALARTLILYLIAIISWLLIAEYFITDSMYRHDGLLIILVGGAMAFLYISISIVHIAKSAYLSMQLREFYPFLLFLMGVLGTYYLQIISAYILMIVLFIAIFICFLISIILSKSYIFNRKNKSNVNELNVSIAYRSFWGTSIIGSLFAQSDILILRYFIGDTEFGIYALIRRVTNLISLPQVIANWVIVLEVAKNYSKGNLEGLKKNANDGLWIAVPMSILMASFILLSYPIWFDLFNAEISISAIVILSCLVFAQLFNVLSGANFLFASQCNEEQYVLSSRIICLILGLVLMTIGGFYFGSLGVAIALGFSIALVNVLVVLRVKSKVGIWTSINLSQ